MEGGTLPILHSSNAFRAGTADGACSKVRMIGSMAARRRQRMSEGADELTPGPTGVSGGSGGATGIDMGAGGEGTDIE